MEIKCIFAESLFSFKYDNLFNSEYNKKLFHWQDNEYIYEMGLSNGIEIEDIDQFFEEIFYDREYLISRMTSCVEAKCLYDIFTNLHTKGIEIAKFEESKGKFFINSKKRLSKLRLYALRLEASSYIVTGGAIKFSQKMQDNVNTSTELERIKICRNFLINQDYSEEDIIDNVFESPDFHT